MCPLCGNALDDTGACVACDYAEAVEVPCFTPEELTMLHERG